MAKPNFSTLADRVEALTGPDRLTDCDIRLAVLGDCDHGVITGNDFEEIGPSTLSACISQYRGYINIDSVIDEDLVPRYTGSVDAAMMLVPEGLSFEARRSGTGDKGQATVWDPMKSVREREWRVTGCASPALALTAAAIRAHSAKEPTL